MSGPARPRPEERSAARIRIRLGLAAVFVVALAVRVWATAAFQGFDSPPDGDAFPDQVDYEEFAFELSEGRGYRRSGGEPTACRAPGTSFTLLPVYLAFGRSHAAARLWFCLLSALTCLAAAWLARAAFGVLAGLLAGAILALDPGHFYYAIHLVSEVPYGLFATLGTALSFSALRRERTTGSALLWDLAAGACYGFAALIRPQILLLSPVAFVVALLAGRAARAAALRHAALASAAALLIVAPWIARNAAVMGSAQIYTLGGSHFWGSNNELVLESHHMGQWVAPDPLLPEGWAQMSEAERSSVAWREGLAFLRENPAALPRLELAKLGKLLSFSSAFSNRLLGLSLATSWRILAPLLLAGLVLAWRRNRCAAALLHAQLAALLGTVLVFSGHWRYRHTVEPFIAVAAGLALAALLGRLSRRSPAGAPERT